MRRNLLLAALGWGVSVVLLVAGYALFEEDVGDMAVILAGGMILLIPIALPWLALRSRWYRLAALLCVLVAAPFYVLLILVGSYLLWPSALLLLASALAPQPR